MVTKVCSTDEQKLYSMIMFMDDVNSCSEKILGGF